MSSTTPDPANNSGAERGAIPPGPAYRSGFVALIGRPNSGKSTLTNALVGSKVAITSNRPQTTRRAIRGVVHRPDAQIVLVDTPGIHRPRTLLGERLNELVDLTVADTDIVAICLPANEPIGPGDRRIIARRPDNSPAIAVVTKIDLVKPDALAVKLAEVGNLADFEAIVPVSAVSGGGVETLARVLADALPVGPPLYPDGQVTDESIEQRIAEYVREAALEGVRDELPHSLAVTVDEIAPRPGTDLTNVHVTVHVERDSQKGIVIGHRGSRLAQIGRTARREIERLLGTRVYLDLHVRVAKDWQRDPKLLRRLGM